MIVAGQFINLFSFFRTKQPILNSAKISDGEVNVNRQKDCCNLFLKIFDEYF